MAGIHTLEDVRWLHGIHSLEVCYDNRPTSLSVFRRVAKIVEEIKMCTFLSKYLNVIPLYCLGHQEQYLSAEEIGIKLIFSKHVSSKPTTAFASFDSKKIFLMKQFFKSFIDETIFQGFS
jgi:hypothetical protein